MTAAERYSVLRRCYAVILAALCLLATVDLTLVFIFVGRLLMLNFDVKKEVFGPWTKPWIARIGCSLGTGRAGRASASEAHGRRLSMRGLHPLHPCGIRDAKRLGEPDRFADGGVLTRRAKPS